MQVLRVFPHFFQTNVRKMSEITAPFLARFLQLTGDKSYRLKPVFTTPYSMEVKDKRYPVTDSKAQRGGGGDAVNLNTFMTPALEGGGWSAPPPGRFTPGKDSVPIVQEAGWAPGPVWTCAKNSMEVPIKYFFLSRETPTYENIDGPEKADCWERNLITTKLWLR
jgi:hypothetical protein